MSYQYWHSVQYPYTGKMYIQEIQKGKEMMRWQTHRGGSDLLHQRFLAFIIVCDK